jgi:hypothetical protein
MRNAVALLTLCLSLGGCTLSPSINVLGAYFPGWLFCIVGGVLIAVVTHKLMSRETVADRIGQATVPWLAPIVALLAALLLWITLFQN